MTENGACEQCLLYINTPGCKGRYRKGDHKVANREAEQGKIKETPLIGKADYENTGGGGEKD